MKIDFPSREFDDAVAAVCHGLASDEQLRGLNELLRGNLGARDEYIVRLEVHSRLASAPDLFAREIEVSAASPVVAPLPRVPRRARSVTPVFALAASLALLAAGWFVMQWLRSADRKGTTSKAVAMLNRAVDAEWNLGGEAPRLGAPLEPGWLRLKSGFAQIVFYSGVRVVMEGPAELQLVSPGEAVFSNGRLIAEVPPPAKGFQVRTPRMAVTDLGTVFGVEVTPGQTELHVFSGSVEFQTPVNPTKQGVREGQGAIADGTTDARLIPANRQEFAALFDLQNKSSEAEVLRHEQWSAASSRLDEDPSLLVHFDFEQEAGSEWRLGNVSKLTADAPDGTIVGCQWTEGRWPDKQALAFRGVSDRVRLEVSGEYESLTLATWLRVQGLDRQINSLFMSDGFEAGTVHWSIRQDGVLALTAIGVEPGQYQICTSPPALSLDQFGLWVHLAVVVDGGAKRVVHYVNGDAVSDEALRISAPFRVGVAELGNWNARGFPKSDPFMIRNFSGAIDEFCLFGRALAGDEIRKLHSSGKPQPDSRNEARKRN